MKKKLLIILSLVFVIACVLAISASAETFNVTYFDGGTQKEIASTDGNGQITLRDEGYSTPTDTKSLLGWFTYEGDMYKPGETITLTKDTNLYQFFGYKATQKNFQTTESQWWWTYVQLQEDIVLESSISINDGGRLYIDLNGHTITSSASNVFSQQRAGVVLVGEGNIVHSGNGSLFRSSYHFYGPNNVCLYIGKDVNIETNGTLYSWNIIQNDLTVVVPFEIYGTVTCKQLLHIDSSIDDYMGIVLNPKKLTVTGDNLFKLGTYPETSFLGVQILGGTFVFPEASNSASFWNNDNPTSYNISVSGGTFSNGGSIAETYLLDEFTTTTVEINGVTYTTVLTKGECTHEYEATAEENATCVIYASKTYTCKKCGDTYTVSYGEFAEHNWELISEKQPTLVSVGVREYKCSICQKTKLEKCFVDVANELINITVNTADGEKEVSTKLSDVFVLESIGENQYKLTDLKAFGDYAITDVVAISIPLGIVNINFASNNESLKKLVIMDGADVTINGFSKCTALTHIEIGDASVAFVKGCSNNVIQSVKSEVEGADVSFEAQVFDGKTSFNELKLSSNSKYTFGANSFRYTNITEFIAPDYSDVTFKNEAAFYKCNSLKYIYIGRGIEVLGGKPFDYCQYVEKVVLMDVKTISMEWTFCVQNMAEKPVEYYIHSSSISLPNNTFGQSKGLVIYTNAPITNGSAFSSCSGKTYNGIDYPAYTIVYGIPHKYVETYEDPTCTEQGVDGYKTDCPCGNNNNLDGSVTVKVFKAVTTNNETYEEITYTSVAIPATGHFEGEVTYIEYLNGYMSYGLKDCICSVCSEAYTEETPSAEALFTFLGYSMPEDGRLEISIGFMINTKAISTYETLTSKTLEYGVVAAIASKLGDKAPLDAENGVAKATLDKSYVGFSFKLSGFTDAHKDLGVVMSAYVSETTEESTTVVYLQEEQTANPKSVSINGLYQKTE